MREQIIQYTEAHRDQVVDTLCDLVKIPSINPPGHYLEISHRVEEIFTEFGLEVQRVEVPVEDLKAEGVETPRINVLGTLKGSMEGSTLLLNPHLDVVPPGDLSKWDSPPFLPRIENGIVYGRGVNDDKGDIAAYAWALRALRECGVPIKGKAVIAATVDEESGGHLGAKFLLEKGYINPDMAIVEGYSHHVFIASNGVVHLRITTTGVTAHAAHPLEGLNAIEKMTEVIKALQGYRDSLALRKSAIDGIDHPTLNFGTIHGGEKTNIVPDRCVLTIDRRVLPGEEARAVAGEISDLLDRLKERDPSLHIETSADLLAESWGPLDRNHRLVRSLSERSLEITGEEPLLQGSTGFNDARFYFRRNIPVVLYGAGPKKIESGRAHGYNELLSIQDLINTVQVVALTTADLLS